MIKEEEKREFKLLRIGELANIRTKIFTQYEIDRRVREKIRRAYSNMEEEIRYLKKENIRLEQKIFSASVAPVIVNDSIKAPDLEYIKLPRVASLTFNNHVLRVRAENFRFNCKVEYFRGGADRVEDREGTEMAIIYMFDRLIEAIKIDRDENVLSWREHQERIKKIDRPV